MGTNNEVRVDTSLIPERVRQEILAAAWDGAVQFFKQPGAMEEFEQWRAERRKRAEKAAQGREVKST